MYNSFFGFKEKPFKLVPNPDYIFMSKSHEIAMAHLIYATDQGDGFVVITGEVGTGKTTLCRNFLELVNDQSESAYIFNPNLNAAELLASICTEFGIEHANGTVKELLDILNLFLIRQNEAGRKAILLIDEAQNLTVENLEMIRMLSNLETTRSKLLQIILVGQPELNDKLDSHELRQLAQRISLNYYLTPLSARETGSYIQHRLHIAAQRQLNLFSARACRSIHRYANGIPRLINIVCDRALLTAFSLNLNKVTGAVVKTAIKELSGRSTRVPRWPLRTAWGAVGGVLLGAAVAAMIYAGVFNWPVSPAQQPVSAGAPTATPGATGAVSTPAAAVFKIQDAVAPPENADPPEASSGEAILTALQPAAAPPADAGPPVAPNAAAADAINPGGTLATHIAGLDPEDSRIHAAEALLALWQQPSPSLRHIPAQLDDHDFFEIASRQYGLRLHRLEDNWLVVRRLNMPAIVSVRDRAANRSAYLTLVGWRGERLYLQDQVTRDVWDTDWASLRPYLAGPVHIFWKNVLGFDAILSQGANNQAVLAVKELLRQAGYPQIAPAPVFDRDMNAAIVDFQTRHQLTADGLVGPLTKILLINATKAVNAPQLDLHRGTGA